MVTYSRGALGGEVDRLQSRLSVLGFYKHAVDAEFGAGTERRDRLQRQNGIPPTGIVDGQTRSLSLPAR
jgi:peptidoglycan hydrolase-like protein with peptidoglycan-binding domain